MFQRVEDARFVAGEHEMLRFWEEQGIFRKLLDKNRGKPKWSFLDGPITANNPMGVHHAWGRTYKDAYQRYFAMTGHELRYQNGFDCQGLWVEVEVEKELQLASKKAINEFGIDRFVWACKQRVLKYAARQTEQSIRLGYWMEWDVPGELRKLAAAIGRQGEGEAPAEPEGSGVRSQESAVSGQQSAVSSQRSVSGAVAPSTINHQPSTTYRTARGQSVSGPAEQIVARLGNPEWGGSYFTFSTENNETIWTFLKKCFTRKKVYKGHDVMPWGGKAGSAYSQMEVADGRRLTTHRSCFVRFPIIRDSQSPPVATGGSTEGLTTETRRHGAGESKEFLLVWTTTPWTLTSNVACAVNAEETYVRIVSKRDGAAYYLMEKNLNSARLEKEFKEGFGGDWAWPQGVPKLKTIAQLFKEQGGYEIEGTLLGEEIRKWRYVGPFDELNAQSSADDHPRSVFFGPNAERVKSSYQAFVTELGSVKHVNAALLNRCHQLLMEGLDDLFISAMMDGWIKPPRKPSQLDDPLSYISDLGFSEQCNAAWSEALAADFLIQDAAGNVSWLDSGAERVHVTSQRWNELSKWSELTIQAVDLTFLRTCVKRQSEAINVLAADLERLPKKSAAESHRVIDGGRDSKGNPNVVAGEGTGIVHIAPGCGDIDHKIGVELGLPVIAPLKEDGTYGEGFGPFTGREAIAPETADLVFEELKRKGHLVYVETYPHIYPHCWRTGEELVFRLVDEWFINMDWRDEIKEVTKTIAWLPPSVQGEERELEWLSTMRDWMISKKRFWGLALPIWVNPDDPADFEVIGSLAELKERATSGGAGWEEFEGNTPHRPWIDRVKIPSRKHPGKLLQRIEDVGNPWLDAGIVPFSTLNWSGEQRGESGGMSNQRPDTTHPAPNTKHQSSGAASLSSPPSALRWKDWFPADFVVECFPGQFRNWFYSLLSLATMMRYDETDDPAEKRPFKNLLGHRLVMDEQGRPMHKSDGTAIWFEEAAEQLGVDTLRWMYLAQPPASDLRFGLRHKDQPVTLETVDGPIAATKEGLPTCKVTSTPADEVRRQVLIPLWNSYAFFVNYAVLDEFDPSLPQAPLAQRPEIDRWVLSRLQELTATAHESFQAFDVARFMQAAAGYIDDLSNWYIRRNRRRFWRARGDKSQESRDKSQSPGVATPGSWEPDKLAAYQTLYEVLVTLTKLLAPAAPFLAERMYQNLVAGEGTRGEVGDRRSEVGPLTTHHSPLTTHPESVHLCDYPVVDPSKLDPQLNWATQQVQALVTMGHRLREAAERRVRQPLAELRFATSDARQAAAIEQYADVIADELNVKRVVRAEHLDELVSYVYKPNLKTLGPKFGKRLGEIKAFLDRSAKEPEIAALLAPLRKGESVSVEPKAGTGPVTLAPEDVMVSTQQATDWASADDAGIQIALSTKLTPELIREGMARDLIRHVQQLRKDADLEENQRIRIEWSTEGENGEFAPMLAEWSDAIRQETRADAVARLSPSTEEARTVTVGDAKVSVRIVALEQARPPSR